MQLFQQLHELVIETKRNPSALKIFVANRLVTIGKDIYPILKWK